MRGTFMGVRNFGVYIGVPSCRETTIPFMTFIAFLRFPFQFPESPVLVGRRVGASFPEACLVASSSLRSRPPRNNQQVKAKTAVAKSSPKALQNNEG